MVPAKFAFDEDVDPYYERRETVRTPAFAARHQGYIGKFPGGEAGSRRIGNRSEGHHE
jgi:hypothetical protein